jgi:hypothetical protein
MVKSAGNFGLGESVKFGESVGSGESGESGAAWCGIYKRF